MEKDINISVNTIPCKEVPKRPYFWCITEYKNKKWYKNHGWGWEYTIEKAFEVAYNKFKKLENE